jgi:hypothetical protein
MPKEASLTEELRGIDPKTKNSRFLKFIKIYDHFSNEMVDISLMLDQLRPKFEVVPLFRI